MLDPRAPSAVAIDLCDEGHKNSWNEYLAGRGGASHYHLFQWRDINERSLGHRPHYLLARSGDRIVGVLPLIFIESRLMKRALCSMPFVNYGGPCADSPDIAAQLIRAAVARADELRADYLELRCIAEHDVGLPVSLRKVSMTLPLAPNPDTVWEKFSSKHRTNVRRAYKNGLATTGGGAELLDEFYALMEWSWKTLGTPLYKRDYFADILRTFPESTRIFICRRDKEPIAAAFNGYFNGVVEGLWAAGSPLARKLDANFVLYWDMMKDACERGMTKFHLGRSTAASGGEEFKRKWNADTTQLYWYFHRPDSGPMPEVNVDNPKYRMAIAAWRRMPMWMTRMAGPMLARLIP